MKRTFKAFGLWGFLLTASLAGALPAYAAATVVPDSPVAIWQSIDQEMIEISEAVGVGALDDLHEHALAVRDLVAALFKNSAGLPSEQREKITLANKLVSIQVGRLEASGHNNDRVGIRVSLSKLKAILKALRTSYSIKKEINDEYIS